MYEINNQKQITNHIMMVRPASFGFNEETAENNAFQEKIEGMTEQSVKKLALLEFDRLVQKLRDYDIDVLVIEDTPDPVKTDAVFPNNWISFHENGTVITYPMFSGIRRNERREDIFDIISTRFEISRRYSFEYFEAKNQFLEGTGSMVFDRINRIVYACLSERTHPQLLDKFSVLTKFRKIFFHASDRNNDPIYHTNVMMAMGIDFVVICLDSIKDTVEKNDLLKVFHDTNKEIIEITIDQMYSFAGNMLQVQTAEGIPLLVMSERAFKSLYPEQVKAIRNYTDILYCPIPVIESYGGGSVRCMMAEIFLPQNLSQPDSH